MASEVRLRDVRLEDQNKIRQWRNLPEVARYMYTNQLIEEEEHARWFASAMQDPSQRFWIIVCDGEDVGLVSISNIDTANSRCYWAFYIVGDVRGKGVGSFVEYNVLRYVFEDLGLNKLCAEVLSFNEAVVAMHKKFGFQEEGVLREHIIKGGQRYDVVTIGLLRSEWEETKHSIRSRLREKGLV